MYALKCHVVNYYGAIYVFRQLNSDGDASHGVEQRLSAVYSTPKSACRAFTGQRSLRSTYYEWSCCCATYTYETAWVTSAFWVSLHRSPKSLEKSASLSLITTNCFRRCFQKTVEDLLCIAVRLIANFRLHSVLISYILLLSCAAGLCSSVCCVLQISQLIWFDLIWFEWCCIAIIMILRSPLSRTYRHC